MPPISLDTFTITTPTNAWESWLQNSPPISSPITTYNDLFNATTHSLTTLLENLPSNARQRTGLILATTKGNIDAQIAYLRNRDNLPTANPPTELPTLSAEAHRLAAHARLNGPVHALSTACSSGITALIDSALTLLDHDADHMLAVALDLASDFVRDGFTSLKALTNICRPFDKNRTGLTLGTASAACLLSRNITPQSRCLLTGYGVASDAIHMTAPDRHARGLITAMQNALSSANLQPDQIDALLLHGTGTPYNDAMEAVAIDSVFRPQNQKGPALTAVKGLIGHTLGASALIETLLAASILETGIIPAITGLQTPERPDLDFVTSKRKLPHINHIMKVASGFGGLNAAIILSRNPHSPRLAGGNLPPTSARPESHAK